VIRIMIVDLHCVLVGMIVLSRMLRPLARGHCSKLPEFLQTSLAVLNYFWPIQMSEQLEGGAEGRGHSESILPNLPTANPYPDLISQSVLIAYAIRRLRRRGGG